MNATHLLLAAALVNGQAFKEYRQDFRGARPIASTLNLVGPNAAAVVKPEPEGLRVTLPTLGQQNKGWGISPKFRVSGDFEITATYEVLVLAPPAKGLAGVALSVAPDGQRGKFGKVGCFVGVKGLQQHLVEVWNREGPETYVTKSLPTEALTGTLRLERKGATLRFLAGEGHGGELREIHSSEFGTEDIGELYLIANNNANPTAVDVRFLSLAIRSAEIPDEAFEPAAAAEPGAGMSGNNWLLLVLLFTLILSALVGAWFFLRRPARDERTPAVKRSAAPIAAPTRRRPALGPLVLGLLALAGGGVGLLAIVLAEGAGATNEKKSEPGQEVHLPLKGTPAKEPSWALIGPDADQFVKFEPEGLRISLPLGHPGERPNTGLRTECSSKGDFEITASYEIIREPDEATAGKRATRIQLLAFLDSPTGNYAGFTRRVAAEGGTQFTTWTQFRTDTGKKLGKFNPYPAAAQTGRLRLVRSGSTLAYYAAEGPDGEFKFLQQYLFSPEDLKEIHLVGSTGGPEALLDFRVSDLRVRSGDLTDVALPATSAPTRWLLAALGISLVVVCGVGCIWLYRLRPNPVRTASEQKSTN